MERSEALDIIRKNWPNGRNQLSEALETLIPELKESEDKAFIELIKGIILFNHKNGVFSTNGISYFGGRLVKDQEILSWLEKQGEHIKFLESIQIGDEVTRNPDGVLVNLSQFKRVAKQGEQNPKFADFIPTDCTSDAKNENRWHKVEDSLPDNAREVLCKDAIGNFFIGRYNNDGDYWEVSMYDEPDKSNKDNPPVIMWANIPSCEQNLANSAKTCKDEPKFKVGDTIKPKDGGHESWQIMQVDISDKKYRFKDGYVIHFSQEDNYELVEQNPADKVEPKFKAGDWIIRNNEHTNVPVQVIEFKGYYRCELNGEVVTLTLNDVHNNFHLWTIKDAKDGDVLATTQGSIFIFKHLDKTGRSLCQSYCEVIGNSGLGLGFEFSINDVYPATKEQRDLLFQKMKEAGYEWDAEKKELKKVEQKPSIEICPHSIKSKSYLETGHTVEQNHAWSEEDEGIVSRIMTDLENCESEWGSDKKEEKAWLESLKGRVQPQPESEWSEEDRKALEVVTIVFEKHGTKFLCYPAFVHWLKTLPNRITFNPYWKPSDEQMTTLDRACKELGFDESILESLYNDLKKLK